MYIVIDGVVYPYPVMDGDINDELVKKFGQLEIHLQTNNIALLQLIQAIKANPYRRITIIGDDGEFPLDGIVKCSRPSFPDGYEFHGERVTETILYLHLWDEGNLFFP